MNKHSEVIAEFVDKYGTTKKIRKTKHGLQVQLNQNTVVLGLSRVISKMSGSKIRDKRIAANLTLQDLCVKAGIPTGTPKSRMWEIENAIRSHGVRLGTIYAIAVALGVDASELLPTNQEVLEAAGVKMEQKLSLSIEK